MIIIDKRKKYIYNSILLSAVSLIIRAITVSFNAYVTKKIGTEALGLFTLCMSVYSFGVTLAVSGVNLAAVRMSSEALAICEQKEVSGKLARKIIREKICGCILYALIFGLFSTSLLFSLSGVIGEKLLGDVRAVSSLRLSSLALTPIALSSALAGYFTGLRKIVKNALAAFFEQFVKISATSILLLTVAPRGIEYACLSVVGGAAIGEGLSFFFNLIMYLFDRIKLSGKNRENIAVGKTGLITAGKIAFPVAIGSYIRQGLMCAEHIAIPDALRKFGQSYEASISSYGVLQGMALPLILFPASVTGAFSSLLIPELAEFSALKKRDYIKKNAEAAASFALCFAIGSSSVFLTFGGDLATAIYSNTESGKYIAALASLVPIMYLDTTVDCILKGVGEQLFCMKVNIADAFLSLIFVLILVPRMGISGYIICIYASEIINASVSISKAVSVTGMKIKAKSIISPLVKSTAVSLGIKLLSEKIYLSAAAEIALFVIIYGLLSINMPISKVSPRKVTN